jgi:hypothetical protein
MTAQLGRRERTLAINGDYVRFTPSTSIHRLWPFLEDMWTTSYDIRSVTAFQPRQTATALRLTVHWENSEKRYDVEAESAPLAGEHSLPISHNGMLTPSSEEIVSTISMARLKALLQPRGRHQ